MSVIMTLEAYLKTMSDQFNRQWKEHYDKHFQDFAERIQVLSGLLKASTEQADKCSVENLQLKHQIEQITKDKLAKETIIEKLRGELLGLKESSAKIEAQSSQVADLTKQVKDLSAEVEKMRHELILLQSRKEEAERLKQKAEAQVVEIRSTHKRAMKEVKSRKKEEAAQQLKDVQMALATAEGRLRAAESDARLFKSLLDKKQTERSTADQRKDDLIVQMTAEIAGIKSDCEERVFLKDGECRTLKHKVQEQEVAVKNLRQRIITLEGELRARNEEFETAIKNERLYREQIKKLETTIGELTTKLQKMQEEARPVAYYTPSALPHPTPLAHPASLAHPVVGMYPPHLLPPPLPLQYTRESVAYLTNPSVLLGYMPSSAPVGPYASSSSGSVPPRV